MKARLEKYDDQAYYVYLGTNGTNIGRVEKFDTGDWRARTPAGNTRRFHYRAEAVEFLRLSYTAMRSPN